LAPSLTQALRELERTVQNAPFDPATSTRRFTLAMSDGAQIATLPAFVDRLAREMPHARLRVVGIDTYFSWGGVAGTEIDAAIVGVQDKSAGVHMIPLYREDSVLVARRANRLVREPLTRARFASLQHVDVQVAPGRGYSELARAYARLGITREVVAVVPSFVAAAAVVAVSDWVATLPASLIAALGESLRLRVVKGAVPKVTTELKLVWHERTLNDAAASAFRDVLVNALAPVEVGARRHLSAPEAPSRRRLTGPSNDC
jgi:DNA-binding transcriptional LysR family regulator